MMATTAARPVRLPAPRHRVGWSVLLVLAVLSSVAIWLAHLSMRRVFVGKVDPETGSRFTFTVGSEFPVVEGVGSGWSAKRDNLHFSLPKPSPLQAWFESHLLHKTPYPYTFPNVKNEISICSGDMVRAGKRSPFRNFDLDGDYPSPRHPDFVDLPGSKLIEETHLLVSGQPALWRVTRVDLPPNPIATGARGKGSYKFYTCMLVVKVKERDSWFAVVGNGDEDHYLPIQREVRAVGDSLHIEKTSGK